MALVPHKITALAESDAQGTDGKNIIAGAVVSLYTAGGTAVTLFDDAAGSNGSTTKQTDSQGTVVVYVNPGEYDEEINTGTRRRVVVSDFLGSNPAEQRATLGLGSAATRDVGEDAGDVMERGAFGLGGLAGLLGDYDIQRPCGFYSFGSSATPSPGAGQRATINVTDDNGSGFQLAGRGINNEFSIRSVTASAKEDWVDLIHTGNAVGQDGIVESGINANGRFTKFIDGTMICTISEFVDDDFQIGARVNIGAFTFPAAFATNANLSVQSEVALSTTTGGRKGFIECVGNALISLSPSTTETPAYFVTCTDDDFSATRARVMITATGRWK